MDRSIDGISRELVDFVTRTFVVSENDFDKDRSLIEQGVIDSFGLVEITTFIGQHFGVAVREEDMTREKFGSLNKMARFVAARIPAESSESAA